VLFAEGMNMPEVKIAIKIVPQMIRIPRKLMKTNMENNSFDNWIRPLATKCVIEDSIPNVKNWTRKPALVNTRM
jgi:hypothetical protein